MSQRGFGDVSAVLENRSFLYLWLAQALSQTALNALLYILLIRVEEWTGSSTAVGALILSFIVPSVVIGVVAGVFVDRAQKKAVLLVTNLLRALIVATFLVLAHNFWLVLLVNLTFSVVSQFFAPAELAVIPAVVPKSLLLVANGLFNLTLNSAQLMGFVILGPLLAKGLSGTAVFGVISAIYVVCVVLIWMMQLEEPEIHRDGVDLRASWISAMVTELREGWRLLVYDNSVSLSIMHLTLVNSLILVIGMLAPGYVNRVLGIRPDDAVFVLAPAALGMLAGIFLLPRLSRRWTKQVLADAGIFSIACVLFFLGMVGQLGQRVVSTGFLSHIGPLALPEKASLVTVVMLLALVLGVGYAFVNISAQTLVQERVPLDLRGRVFAAQLAFANAAAVLPLIFLGGLADLIGINQVTYLAAVVVLAAGLLSSYQARRFQTSL